MRTLIRNLTYMAILALVLSVASALPARASTVVNISVPTELFVFVPCANGGAGEVIDVSGPLHILIEETFDSAGGFHAKIHYQPQGISGVGLTTGAKYQATGVTQSEFNIGPNGFPAEETDVNNFRMIGQGPGNNFLVHEVFHITINANGTVTALFDHASVDCK